MGQYVSMIEISGHHAENEISMYGYGGCTGYDRKHTRVAVALIQKILITAGPETAVNLLLGPDAICNACPLNKKGKRFKRKLPKRIGIKSCNPNSKKIRSANESAAREIERIIDKPNGEITAGDFQEWRRRKDYPLEYFALDVLSEL